MSVVVKVYVENPDEILNAGHSGAGAVVQLQRDTVEAFTTPVDVTTVPIVTLTRSYTAYDASGTSSSWYRTRYETSAGAATSDWSIPFQVGAGGYCDLDDVKQRVDRIGDTANDELFSEYIDEATDYIRGYTSREFIDTGLIYTFDGYAATHGGRCLLLPRGARSLSLVETAATTGAAFTTVPSTDYLLRPPTQDRTPGWPATALWLTDNATSLRTFPRGYDTVRLTGAFGFLAVPQRVQEVALNLVVRIYASRQAGQADILGAGDSGAPLVSSFLSRRDRDTLDKFTAMQVA